LLSIDELGDKILLEEKREFLEEESKELFKFKL
jgi:hypothetical protein